MISHFLLRCPTLHFFSHKSRSTQIKRRLEGAVWPIAFAKVPYNGFSSGSSSTSKIRPSISHNLGPRCFQPLFHHGTTIKAAVILNHSPRVFNATATSSDGSAETPNSSNVDDSLPVYQPPTRGILSLLPSSWVPYAELARIEKPTGIYYLFLPCIFSTFFSSIFFSATALPSPTTLLATNAVLLFGSILFRSAACSWNDTLDRELDAKVSRTRLRPLPRGAVTPRQAHKFTAAQVILGTTLSVTCFPFPTFALYAAPSVVLIALYPLMKRVTYYPQIILGFAWSWGIIMGFPAMGIDLSSAPPGALAATSTLYAANLMWMILGDTIYAFQDLKDDVKVGIKSMAVEFVVSQRRAKWIFASLATTQVSLLAFTGLLAGAGPIYAAGTVVGTALSLGTMIWKVRLGVPENCWWWFKWGVWFTGGSMASGIVGEYWFRWTKQCKEQRISYQTNEASSQ